MENQIQIQSRNTNLCLVLTFSIYTTIHFIITIYYSATDVDFKDIASGNYETLLIHFSIFILFLLTTIFISVNFHRNICIYICLIPSLINELIFIFLFISFIYIITFIPIGSNPEIDILFIIFLFIIESCPNIILFVHICRKSINNNSENIDNINSNSPLLNNN